MGEAKGERIFTMGKSPVNAFSLLDERVAGRGGLCLWIIHTKTPLSTNEATSARFLD
jgi:hypothetical protein